MSEKNAGKPEMTAPAQVSIGLPVFNGERYLHQAIESVLAQSFGDFELLISDNASTDSTWDICRSYAEKDERVRLVRQESNLGAFANFMFVLDHARCPYFMWMSHDDLLKPDYVGRCVSFLESNPDYVLCFAKNRAIDETGEEIHFHNFDEMKHCAVESDDPVERYAACLNNLLPTVEFYGLFRKDVIPKAKKFKMGDGADQVLVLELSLIGKIRRIPEVLRYYRIRTTRTSIEDRLVTAFMTVRPPGSRMPLIPNTKVYVGLISVAMVGHVGPGDSMKLVWIALRHKRLFSSVWWDTMRLVQLLAYRYPPLYNFLRSVSRAASGYIGR